MKLSCIGVILLVTLAAQIQPVPGSYITSIARNCFTRIVEYFLVYVFPKDPTMAESSINLLKLAIAIEKDLLKKIQISKRYKRKCKAKFYPMMDMYKKRNKIRRLFRDSPRSITTRTLSKRFITYIARKVVENIEQFLEILNQLIVKYAMKSRFWTKD